VYALVHAGRYGRAYVSQLREQQREAREGEVAEGASTLIVIM